MPWHARIDRESTRTWKVAIEDQQKPLSYSVVLRLWEEDAAFRSLFMSILADAPFSAFRWETPPITVAKVNRPFEFVLLDSPGLAAEPDPIAFAEQFRAADAENDVVVFPNLGNDALLVVPCPVASDEAYGHLAAFVRKAPESQKHAMWSTVGKVMRGRLGRDPIWLSTAGAGVSWLHVRLDRRPKYYAYSPYRSTP